jgi:DNA-binding transcriptional regulator YhcF (GntR family)
MSYGDVLWWSRSRRRAVVSDIADKWGEQVAQRGFAQIPNYLLLLNQFLLKEKRLSPVELLVLIQLVGSWWKKDAMPFPSMTTLATRCGVSSRQIQRAINRLEGEKLIRRVNRRTQGVVSSNAYDLEPLVGLLNVVADAFPNDFPRNVDRKTAEQVEAKIQAARLADLPF